MQSVLTRNKGALYWGVKFNGVNTQISGSSDASLDNLLSGTKIFQLELWARVSNVTDMYIIMKGVHDNTGWAFGYYGAANISFIVQGIGAANHDVVTVSDRKWHHLVGHYQGTDKTIQIAVDGDWGLPYQNLGGAYVSDAAAGLSIGNCANVFFMNGALGWVRFHNHAHYTPGANFTPPSKAFPGTDANTVEAWAVREGAGTTLEAQVVSPANNCTIWNGTWIKWA